MFNKLDIDKKLSEMGMQQSMSEEEIDFVNFVNFIHIAKNAGTSMQKFITNNPELNIKYHGHNAPISKLSNQMIIIRNPLDRFCSAVEYAIKYYSDSTKIQKILAAGLTTPSDWAEAWANPTSPYHPLILNEVMNHSHEIDNKSITYKWTYEPQISWYKAENIAYIIRFENIDQNFMKLFNKKISKENKSLNKAKKHKKMSETAINFLREFYRSDFELWESANI